MHYIRFICWHLSQILLKTNIYIILIELVLISILILILSLKYNYQQYKIENKFFTFLKILYFFSLCFIILYLRFLRLPIDLISIITQFKYYYGLFFAGTMFYKICIFLYILIIILLWLLCMFKFYKISKNELIKIHFYLIYKQPKKYYNFCLNFMCYFSAQHFRTIFIDIIVSPLLTTFKTLQKYFNIICKVLGIIFDFFPYFLLISLLIYDCYFNNYILKNTTIYLPYLYIIILWKMFSYFVTKADNNSLNQIIMEKYYFSDSIYYINLSDEQNNIIKNYIKNFSSPISTIFDDSEYLNPILLHLRYIKNKNKLINYTNKTYFYFSDLIIKNNAYYCNPNNIKKLKK